MVRPKLAIWKLSSCDGCQLQLLDLEEQLLELSERVELCRFLEASRRTLPGPYDISLVEGAVSTPQQARQVKRIRAQSRLVVAIGACATAGGIQGVRNFFDFDSVAAQVYPHPEYLQSLAQATPVSEHITVDHELHGCPIEKAQLLELMEALLAGRRPDLPAYAQCQECKAAGTPCVMVTRGQPCLGPVTRAGCGNRCPAVGRGCYGCFGPAEAANLQALGRELRALGLDEEALRRWYRLFNAWAPGFREAAADG
jgi:coenzyme F420-reducing hydrogenase gamma subunit